MTDYSRAGSPGDRGLVTPPAGGGSPGPNGTRDHAGREPGGDAPPDDPGAGEPSPTGATNPAGLALDGLDLDGLDLDDLELEDLEDIPELARLTGEPDAGEGDGDGEPAEEAPPRPREPVGRRTMLISLGIAGAGLIALVVAVVFAMSGIGPIDRPLLISPLGLDGPPASTAGAVAVPPKPGGKVPRVVGMAFARARAIVEGAGFRVEARYQQGSQPRETVVAQSPEPGTELGRRGVVTLVVSLGITGPVSGPLPTAGTSAPPTTRRPTATTRPTNTTARPTTTDPPTTDPPTTDPPTTDPPTTVVSTNPVGG